MLVVVSRLLVLFGLVVTASVSLLFCWFSDTSNLVEERGISATHEISYIGRDKHKDGFILTTEYEDLTEVERMRQPLKRSSRIDCIALTDIEEKYKLEVLQRFSAEFVLHREVLSEKFASHNYNDLVLEFELGDYHAAFELGMRSIEDLIRTRGNSSFHDVERSLDLSTDDKRLLEKSRQWLWEAATNGVSIALAELAGTYKLEQDYLIKEREFLTPLVDGKNLQKKISELKAKEYSYQRLFSAVAPQINELLNVDFDFYENRSTELTEKQKEETYKEIYATWVRSREELGDTSQENIDFGSHVRDAILSIRKKCN